MPRSIQDILDNADELAMRFENYEPDPADERDPKAFEAVRAARSAGYSWSLIGSLIGTSGEAARQRYGAIGAEKIATRPSI